METHDFEPLRASEYGRLAPRLLPMMPGIEAFLPLWLDIRAQHLRNPGIDPDSVESLLSYARRNGRAVCSTQQLWTKLKPHVETASPFMRRA